MAAEATIRSSLQIKADDIEYQSRPTAYTADVTGRKGPAPGAFTATIAGTDVDFSELTTPSLCRIQNQDATNRVDVGIWDPETGVFYPVDELLPGESYVRRLSRNLAGEYGTDPPAGTTGPNTNRLRVRAFSASCVVLVEAFEL